MNTLRNLKRKKTAIIMILPSLHFLSTQSVVYFDVELFCLSYKLKSAFT